MNLLTARHVHMIGIGGIGLSALAGVLKARGCTVTGSDATESPVAESLRRGGVEVAIGHRAEQVYPDTELVVYSVAVPPENPEPESTLKPSTKTWLDQEAEKHKSGKEAINEIVAYTPDGAAPDRKHRAFAIQAYLGKKGISVPIHPERRHGADLEGVSLR